MRKFNLDLVQKAVFEKETHTYHIDYEFFTSFVSANYSVTEVIKGKKTTYSSKKMEIAAQVGTEVHEHLSMCFEKGIKPLTELTMDMYNQVISLVGEHPVIAEEKLIGTWRSEQRNSTVLIGGSPDLYCLHPTKGLIVIDFKTAGQFSADWRIQLSVYAQMLKEYLGLSSHKITCYVVRPGCNPEFVANQDTIPYYVESFVSKLENIEPMHELSTYGKIDKVQVSKQIEEIEEIEQEITLLKSVFKDKLKELEEKKKKSLDSLEESLSQIDTNIKTNDFEYLETIEVVTRLNTEAAKMLHSELFNSISTTKKKQLRFFEGPSITF